MGITSAFYIAQSGLMMAQRAMEVVSHNISNVNTPGYSRQYIPFETTDPYPSTIGPLGTGVGADDVLRNTDKYLVKNLIEKSGYLAKYEAQKTTMDAIESIFNESFGSGLNEALSEFWNAWQDVANNPEGNAERVNLIEKTDTLTQTINVMKQDLDEIRSDINFRIEEGVIEVNTLTKEIASLNEQIALAEKGGLHQANDLRDSREQALKELSELMDIQYYEDPANGSVTVMTWQATTLVSENSSWDLTAQVDKYTNDVHVLWEDSGGGTMDITEHIDDGLLGGLIELRDDVMGDFYHQMEAFTETLIVEVNRQHTQGVGLTNYTDLTSDYDISDYYMYRTDFEGYDNNLVFKARSEGAEGELIGIKFVKNINVSEELRVETSRAGNDFNITVYLPINAAGQVTATAEEVLEAIRDDSSANLPSPAPFPPAGPPYHAGDLITVDLARGEQGSGIVYEMTNPNASNGYFQLNNELQNVLEFGDQIQWQDYAGTQTKLNGDNNDLLFSVTADWLQSNPNLYGEGISIEYNDNGSQPPVVNVSGNRIVIDIDGGVTTANDIIDAVNNNAWASRMVSVQRVTANSGEGTVSAMDRQYLDRSGSFDLVVYDKEGKPTVTTIYVRPTDTKQDVMDQINAIEIDGFKPISAGDHEENEKTYMRLQTEEGYEFAFSNDTSGALLALGLNTFFSGHAAYNIEMNDILKDDVRLMATGRVDEEGMIQTGDNTNALDIADVKDKKFLIGNQWSTISESYNTLAAEVGAQAASINNNHDFNSYLVNQLEAQRDMVSAVNLDEEMANLLKYQYMYQASAKMISTVDEMLQTLLNVI